MKSVEDKIDKKSDYFINSPTDAITEHFLYPTHLGAFFLSARLQAASYAF